VNKKRTYTITISAEDADGDSLTYYIDGEEITGNSKTFPQLNFSNVVRNHTIKVYDGTEFSEEVVVKVVAD